MDPAKPSHHFLSLFPASQKADLSKRVELLHFPDQALIFEEGSESNCLYLVITGRVAMTKKSPGGSPQILAHKKPDEYFGELGALDGTPRSTSALAVGPVLLGRLTKEDLLISLASSPWQTVLKIFVHISEDLRATNERYVSEVVRKEKMTLVGEMANSMIHDFRNPFSTISLATELIARDNPAKRTQDLCTMILGQLDHLGGMVEEVLEFARGETRLKIKLASLQDSFLRLKENNRESLARTGVQLQVSSTDLILPLDAARFLRVLQNLITNAQEALAKRPDALIEISAQSAGREAVINVVDNGPGIPEDIRSTLFEPFVTQGKSSGTGLGLAIAKSVIEAHRGKIYFTTGSTGTTFKIHLPMV